MYKTSTHLAWHSRLSARIIQQGGLIAYPTETVYGLGCDPLNAEAITKLLDLKFRPMSKGLIIVAATVEQLLPYIETSQSNIDNTLLSMTDQPTTWSFRAQSWVPAWLTGNHTTIAIRLTTHPVAKALCSRLQHPLVSTSANPPGISPARNKYILRKCFYKNVDYIMPGDTIAHGKPSIIKDAETGLIVRQA